MGSFVSQDFEIPRFPVFLVLHISPSRADLFRASVLDRTLYTHCGNSSRDVSRALLTSHFYSSSTVFSFFFFFFSVHFSLSLSFYLSLFKAGYPSLTAESSSATEPPLSRSFSIVAPAVGFSFLFRRCGRSRTMVPPFTRTSSIINPVEWFTKYPPSTTPWANTHGPPSGRNPRAVWKLITLTAIGAVTRLL